MKSTHAQRTWIALCLMVLGIPVLAIWWWLGPNSSLAPTAEIRKRVKWWTAYSPIQLIAEHVSPEQVLRVDGHNYRPVEGGPPFYLYIPELDAIFFVEEDEHHSAWNHFYFMGEHRGIVIKGGGLIGLQIGRDGPNAARVLSASRESVRIRADSKVYRFNLEERWMGED